MIFCTLPAGPTLQILRASGGLPAAAPREIRTNPQFIGPAFNSHHDDAMMRLVEAVKPRVSFTDLQRMPEDGNRYGPPQMMSGSRFEPAALPGLTIDLGDLFVGLD